MTLGRKAAPVGALLFGLAVLTGLVAWRGVGTIGELLAVAGWQLFWLAPFYLCVFFIATQCWRLLFAPKAVPPAGMLLRGVWIAHSVNWLLPVAQVGGEVVRARLAWKSGVAGPPAAGTVIVDKTIQAMTQVVYALIGLGLLALGRAGQGLIPGALMAVAVLAAAIYAFYRLQRAGLFSRLGRLLERAPWTSGEVDFSGGARRLDAAVTGVYARTGRFLASATWRLGQRFVQAGEVWLALLFLGHPVDIADAVILEGLGGAITAAAFMFPGAWGIQEGGFMLLAGTVGLSPEVGLALSLAKRVRELSLGLPGLAAWQVAEGRFLLARGRGGTGAE